MLEQIIPIKEDCFILSLYLHIVLSILCCSCSPSQIYKQFLSFWIMHFYLPCIFAVCYTKGPEKAMAPHSSTLACHYLAFLDFLDFGLCLLWSPGPECSLFLAEHRWLDSSWSTLASWLSGFWCVSEHRDTQATLPPAGSSGFQAVMCFDHSLPILTAHLSWLLGG